MTEYQQINRRVFDRYLTDAEVRRLFAHVRQFAGPYARRDLHWMRLLYHTGLRVGTLAGLTVADAQEALGSGYLNLRADICKGSCAYTVRLGQQARRALRGLLEIRRQMGHSNAQPAAPLLMSRKAKGLSVRSMEARMKHWVAGAGLDRRASPHWFRHSLAKRVQAETQAANPQQAVQLVLGHRDIRSTNIYTLPDKQEIDRLMENLG